MKHRMLTLAVLAMVGATMDAHGESFVAPPQPPRPPPPPPTAVCFKCKTPGASTIDIRTRLRPDASDQTKADVETALSLGGVTYQCKACKAVWMVLPQATTGTTGETTSVEAAPKGRNRRERRRAAHLRNRR